jgi:hypothetical protein
MRVCLRLGSVRRVRCSRDVAVETFGILCRKLGRWKIAGFSVGNVRNERGSADRLGGVGIGRHGDDRDRRAIEQRVEKVSFGAMDKVLYT